MKPKECSNEILEQIIEVTRQLDNASYMLPLPVLNGNTYGKHVRHIIEFYHCLLAGYNSGYVDYDAREHNQLLECNKYLAVDELHEIIAAMSGVCDKAMILRSDYSKSNDYSENATSFNRELVYNIEHAIHHMAIMKIAIESSFHEVKLPEHFGVAYSTIKYQKEKCAQ